RLLLGGKFLACVRSILSIEELRDHSSNLLSQRHSSSTLEAHLLPHSNVPVPSRLTLHLLHSAAVCLRTLTSRFSKKFKCSPSYPIHALMLAQISGLRHRLLRL